MKKSVFLLLTTTLLCGCIIVATELTFLPSDTKVATILYANTTHVIEIGSPDNPYSGTPAIKIKADNRIIFDSSTCTSNTVADYILQNESRDASKKTGFLSYPDCKSMRSEKLWGAEARFLDLLAPAKRNTELPYDEARRQGIDVVAQNNTVKAIRIVDFRRDPKGHMIQIKFGDSEWMDSQLNKKECIQLFGKPVQERNYLPQ